VPCPYGNRRAIGVYFINVESAVYRARVQSDYFGVGTRQCHALLRVNKHVKPTVRQGLKPLPQSSSPLKRTEKKNFKLISPLQRTSAIRQGLQSLADWRVGGKTEGLSGLI